MIYIFYGADRAKKKKAIEKITLGRLVHVPVREAGASALLSYAEHVSLFGDASTILLDDVISEKEEILTTALLERLKESRTIFIFSEDALLAPQLKKYKPFSENIEEYKSTAPKAVKTNPFLLSDLFWKRDRLGAWLAYISQIENGESPEAIAGMLFWRIKKGIMNRERSLFNESELKSVATRIMTDYHRAHRGECDLALALESSILSVL
jgi:DNA polymerase III delta subunit